MKVGLYSITYLGIWYDGPALTFPELVKRAKAYGYAGLELDIRDLFKADGHTVLDGGKVLGGGIASYDGLVAAVNVNNGWYRSLDTNNPSERVVTGGIFVAGTDKTTGRTKYVFLVPSFTPNSDVCGYGGESWLWALSGDTGTAYMTNVIGQEDIGKETDKTLYVFRLNNQG